MEKLRSDVGNAIIESTAEDYQMSTDSMEQAMSLSAELSVHLDGPAGHVSELQISERTLTDLTRVSLFS